MTIQNLWLASDRALVGADTHEVTDDGEIRPCSKILTIPHVNCVVTGSGLSTFFFAMYTRLYALGRDFDGMASYLPRGLPDCFETMMANHATHDVSRPFVGTTEGLGFIIAGWSQKQGRMAAHAYYQIKAAEGFDAHHLEPGCYSLMPGYDEINIPCPNNKATMIDYAREQTRVAREKGSSVCGGDFMIAEVTLGRTVIETVCALDDDGFAVNSGPTECGGVSTLNVVQSGNRAGSLFSRRQS